MEELERAAEDEEDEVQSSRPGRRRNRFIDDEAPVEKRGREVD